MFSNTQGYLQQLDSKARAALVAVLEPRHYLPGEALFCQGEPPRWLFILQEGWAKVTVASSSGREVITELLFAGDVCGALCGLDARYYSAGGECLSSVATLQVPIATFRRLVDQYPCLLTAALAFCRAKYRDQQEALVGLAVATARQRAAGMLLHLGSRLGHPTRHGTTFTMPLSRREFSHLIGTTSESAIRVLSRLRRDGLIRENGSSVTLLDEGGLRRVLGPLAGCDGCRARREVAPSLCGSAWGSGCATHHCHS